MPSSKRATKSVQTQLDSVSQPSTQYSNNSHQSNKKLFIFYLLLFSRLKIQLYYILGASSQRIQCKNKILVIKVITIMQIQ